MINAYIRVTVLGNYHRHIRFCDRLYLDALAFISYSLFSTHSHMIIIIIIYNAAFANMTRV